jgi:2-methylisocitrate lyase-like PEP mutase family enzyme
MIFMNSLESAEEMCKATKAVPKPIKINVVEGHPPARFTSAELFGFGIKLVTYAGVLQRCAGKAMLACLETLRKEDSTEGSLKPLLMTPAERYEVLGLAMYRELETKLFGRGE